MYVSAKYNHKVNEAKDRSNPYMVGWLVIGYLGFNGSLRQYFSLY